MQHTLPYSYEIQGMKLFARFQYKKFGQQRNAWLVWSQYAKMQIVPNANVARMVKNLHASKSRAKSTAVSHAQYSTLSHEAWSQVDWPGSGMRSLTCLVQLLSEIICKVVDETQEGP